MQAAAVSVADLFGGAQRLRAPLFQRSYVWSEDAHIEPFWMDLRVRAALRLEGEPAAAAHFLGAILLQQDPADQDCCRIIDGQQRLLTLFLTLAAIRTVAAAMDLGDVQATATQRLFDADGRPRLTPTESDRRHVTAIVQNGSLKALAGLWRERFAAGRLRLLKSVGRPDCLSAYVGLLIRVRAYVEGAGAEADGVPAVATAAPSDRLAALLDAMLHDIRVVQIALSADDDGPAIFEALNDRGAPLEAADLVRNDIVRRARAAGEDAGCLIARYWRPLADDAYWRDSVQLSRAKAPQLDNLLRCYLISVGQPGAAPKRLFHAYRAYVSRRPPPFDSVSAELAEFARAAAVFRRLAPGDLEHEKPNTPGAVEVYRDDPVRVAGGRAVDWAPSAILPAMLAVAGFESAEDGERERALRFLVGYLVRRDVCRLSRRNLHRAGVALCRVVLAEASKQGLAAAVAHGLSMHAGIDALWPADAHFAQAWLSVPVWRPGGARKARRLLIELEATASGRSTVEIASERPQADHIMPRNWADARGDPWPAPVARDAADLDDAFRRRNRLIDGVGNLALIEPELNARLGNVGFGDRRAAYAGSRYLTTRSLARLDRWDEAAMFDRAKGCLDTAMSLWPGPESVSALLTASLRSGSRRMQ